MLLAAQMPTPENQPAFGVHRRNLSLDGLRGIAVLIVFLSHHGYLDSGWMGVDIFFVLSGYLITTIIWKTRHDRFFWREFWIKRATRILPPLVLVLLFATIFSPKVSVVLGAAYLLSLGDVLAYRLDLLLLQPLWSLAVEEHFYIVWPIAVRLLHRRSLIYLLYGIIIIEPIARGTAIFVTRDAPLIYLLTPFRLDGLALGCLLAMLFTVPRGLAAMTRWSGLGCVMTAGLGLALRIGIGPSFSRQSATVGFTASWYSLIAFVAFFAIAHVSTHPQSLGARILAWKPLAYLGTISYGVYLYHVPIREVMRARFGLSIRGALLVDVPLVLLVSWFSFRLYESPLIAWGKSLSARYRTAGEIEPVKS